MYWVEGCFIYYTYLWGGYLFYLFCIVGLVISWCG